MGESAESSEKIDPELSFLKKSFLKKSFFIHASLAFKIIIGILAFIIVTGGGVVAFYTYDFVEHNPNFCKSCHIMADAYNAWNLSAHKYVECHDCHRQSIVERNKLLVKYMLFRPKEVSERHGKTIVPYTICFRCHWEGDKKQDGIIKINKSYGHAEHVFVEKIECTKCHGIKLHQFLPEERFCLDCHKKKEVHGKEMKDNACLDCHPYGAEARDLRPTREACLDCHEGAKEAVHFSSKGPMDFQCQQCHKPHKKLMPGDKVCNKCHPTLMGQHKIHMEEEDSSCTDCHSPHQWRVREVDTEELCSDCHDYEPYETFFYYDSKSMKKKLKKAKEKD